MPAESRIFPVRIDVILAMTRTLIPFVAACMLSLSAQAQLASPQSITGAKVACLNDKAAGYSCSGIDLMAVLTMSDYAVDPAIPDRSNPILNDVWGWTDPDTGHEYALAGRSNAVAFIDVTYPENPVYVGFLPSHDPEAVAWWRDMKVYRDHMFVVVDGRGANGMQVFDLTELRRYEGTPIHFKQTAHYNGIRQAHNVVINEDTGFAYIVGARNSRIGCGPGLHIVDITEPTNPTHAGCFNDPATGNGGNGYTHDAQCVIYRGADSDYYGREICFGSNVTGLSIADVTDKANPKKLSSVEHPNARYAHQGWLTEDHAYFIMNDELDERAFIDQFGGTRMLIWDVKELRDPLLYREYFGPTETSDHNLYIRNGYVFASNYTSGLRIIDVRDPWKPVEVAYFDTHPEGDQMSFDGAWSAYPFFESGTIVVSSDPHGLFVLSLTGIDFVTETESGGALPQSFALSAAYPNPFNPQTSLTLSLPEAATVSVEAFDLMGRHVARLYNGYQIAGQHQITFDASQLPSGTYVIRALGARHIATQRVMLVK